jgi:hypothetical protein
MTRVGGSSSSVGAFSPSSRYHALARCSCDRRERHRVALENILRLQNLEKRHGKIWTGQ